MIEGGYESVELLGSYVFNSPCATTGVVSLSLTVRANNDTQSYYHGGHQLHSCCTRPYQAENLYKGQLTSAQCREYNKLARVRL